MRKHEGDTRVRKHSRMERFLPPDHATEQAIVQIGHRRFLQLANRFSKLACCLASGSGTGVGQLLRFVAGQIQDRAEVSHLRGGVRLAGASSFCKLLFRSARSFERCPARNREVFINVRLLEGSRRALPATRTWPPRATASIRPGQRHNSFWAALLFPALSSRVDENHPISGRSPQFFCLRSSQRGAACARKRAERHVRLGGHVGRTRCSALRRIRHRHARPCPHKPDSHVRGNASTNSAKASG